jgi:NitT/TauT family transport system permease protein
MKSKLLRFILPFCFWIFIWWLGASIVDNSFLFPNVDKTIIALIDLIGKPSFYLVVLLTTTRVLLGFLFGCALGFVLAILCNKFSVLEALITPIITIIKATPVASFIVLLWVMLSGDALSVFIGFLMVMPIIWQNTMDAFSSIDKNLIEVAEIFEFSSKKKFKLLILPTLKTFLYPAIITSAGLAWKAEIAAEIIAYTKLSIGQGINDAKYNMDTPTVFAWTMLIILFSILLELGTKKLLRRLK